MNEILIENKTIGPGYPPFIIAEMSTSHSGNLERAKKIIRIAAAEGVDSIKLKTYTADSLTLDYDGQGFMIESPLLWAGSTLYDLYASPPRRLTNGSQSYLH